jgi:hypothetical protein
MGTTLITSSDVKFVLANGQLANNVYWKIGSSATIGTGSEIPGSLVAYASISFASDTVLTGYD